MHYQLGSLAALEKLGMRDIPPLTERVRQENEPIPPAGNAFDHFDKMILGNARLGKTAASMSPVPSVAGFKNSTKMTFPSSGVNMLSAPRPQMARSGASVGGLNPLKPNAAPKAVKPIDSRASKPPGMNLQHQVAENAATMDTANSMTSPQRRFMTPL